MKQAYVEGTFEHLIAHKNTVSGRGSGTSVRIAIARAVAKMLKEPNLRGTRISRFKMAVVITDVKAEPKPEAEV